MSNAELVTFGPWGIPVAVKRCLCPDGRRRRARLTGDADTFFSIPASVTVAAFRIGRDGEASRGPVTVSGFVTGRQGDDGGQDYEFIPYSSGKNAYVFDAAICMGCARKLDDPAPEGHACIYCCPPPPPPPPVYCAVCERPIAECERAGDDCPGLVPF